MSRRAVFIAVVIVVGAAAIPLGSAMLWNDWFAVKRLDGVASTLPAGTTEVKHASCFSVVGGRCTGFAIRIVATELEPHEMATFYRERDPSLRFVWAVSGGFRAGDVEGAEHEPPGVILFFLRQWAVLPQGVRRVALYEEFQPTTSLDPRCW